ncbi:hypothetical protein [Pyrofollis japonicus]|nr:hypothetical protein [Pyrofollis japonicus]
MKRLQERRYRETAQRGLSNQGVLWSVGYCKHSDLVDVDKPNNRC